MKKYLLVLMCLLILPQTLLAATRLGLHVTAEELAIWQVRRTNNSTTINGSTYQTIWNNRILPDADNFKNNQSHPGGDGTWSGWSGAGCYPNDAPNGPQKGNGKTMLHSAFVFLVTGDTSYASPVASELLNQITISNADFGNTGKFCIQNQDQSTDGITLWAMKLVHAYDYLIAGGYTGFTTQQKTDIVNYLHNIGKYGIARAVLQIQENVMWGAYDSPPNYDCHNCPGSTLGATHWQGHVPVSAQNPWTNRASHGMWLGAATSILANDTTSLNKTRLWFEQTLQFTYFSDGTPLEMNRWNTDSPNTEQGASSSWGHLVGNVGTMVGIADMIARTGDTSMYTYSTSNGFFGTEGGPKSLLTTLLLLARMSNGTVQRYGTNNGTTNSSTLISHAPEGGHADDLQGMFSNIYYQNSEIRTAMTMNRGTGSGCGGENCWGWPMGSIPDTPFMFGNHDSGQINPYSLAAPSNDPVLHLPFNETIGTSAADATGNGHTGTLYEGASGPQQGPTWIAGVLGNALHCDGSNDNVRVNDAADLDITGDVTIAFWLRLNSTTNLGPDSAGLITKWSSTEAYAMPWTVELDTPAAPHFRWAHTPGSGALFNSVITMDGYTIPTATWIHAALKRTVSNRTITLRTGGVSYPETYGSDDPAASAQPVSLCVNVERTSNRYANVDLDDLRIYPTALSDADIDALAAVDTTAPPAPTNLRVVSP